MNLAISPETGARLAAKAVAQGISIDALLERLLDDTGGPRGNAATGDAPQLPVWHLGLCGSLHRRDIYDDVR